VNASSLLLFYRGSNDTRSMFLNRQKNGTVSLLP